MNSAKATLEAAKNQADVALDHAQQAPAPAIGFTVAVGLSGSAGGVDVVGALLCVPILAYLVHLWLLLMRE